jgi:hypothetical protein
MEFCTFLVSVLAELFLSIYGNYACGMTLTGLSSFWVTWLQVDPGSDDDESIYRDLPDTAGTAAAVARAAHQQPWLQLTKGYRQRRTTLAERHQYDDANAESGPWQRFDLHSVADSMQKVSSGFIELRK